MCVCVCVYIYIFFFSATRSRLRVMKIGELSVFLLYSRVYIEHD
jgi:hypothetical protein